MSDVGSRPLTLDNFILAMNALLVDVYFDLDPVNAGDKLTALANRLHDIASQTPDPERAAIVGGLSAALMMTEDGAR